MVQNIEEIHIKSNKKDLDLEIKIIKAIKNIEKHSININQKWQ